MKRFFFFEKIESRVFLKTVATNCVFQFEQKTENLQICDCETAFFRDEKHVFVVKNWATYCAFQITETTENLQKCVRETEFYVMKNITFCKKQGLPTAHFNLMRLKSVFLPHLRVPICGRCYTNIILWTNAFPDIFPRV